MPIHMLRCKKHGLTKHNVVQTCSVCASENAVATPSASDNTGSPKLPTWKDNKESFDKYLWEIGAGGAPSDIFSGAELYHEFIDRQLRAST